MRYHGRDVAVWRARQRGVPVVLGSATPSLESLVHAQRARYRWLELPLRAVARARGCRSFAFAPSRDPAALEGHRRAAGGGARGEARARRAVPRVHQPARICAVAPLLGVRLAGRLPALQREARRPPRDRWICGATTAATSSGWRDAVPTAATSTCCLSATARSGWSARSPTRFPDARIARIDRDSTRRKGAFAAIRDRVHAGRRRHTGRHPDARQGPRLSAAHAGGHPGRRQCAVQRRFPRDGAARGAAVPGVRARGARRAARRSDRADRFPDASAGARAGRPRLREFRRSAAGGARAPRRCRRSRTSRCSSPKRRAAMRSTLSWPRRARRAGRRHAPRRRRSKCSRRCRRACRVAPGWSGARCSRRRSSAARCSGFCRIGATPSRRCPAGACAGRSTSIRSGSRDAAGVDGGATVYNPLFRRPGDGITPRIGAARAAPFNSRFRAGHRWSLRYRCHPMTDRRTQLESWLALGLAEQRPLNDRPARTTRILACRGPRGRRARARGAPSSSIARNSRSTATSHPTSRCSTRRRCKRNPREFAQALVAALPKSDLVQRIDIAGAGFINIFVTPAARQAVVARILTEGDRFGCVDARAWRTRDGRVRFGESDRAACTSAMAARRRWATRSRACSNGRARP